MAVIPRDFWCFALISIPLPAFACVWFPAAVCSASLCNNTDTNKLRSILSSRDYLSPYSSCLNLENTASSYSFAIPIPIAHCLDSNSLLYAYACFVKYWAYTRANKEFVYPTLVCRCGMNDCNVMHAYSYSPTANPSAENQFFTLASAALRKANHKTSQTSDQNQTDWNQSVMPRIQSVTSRCQSENMPLPFSHQPLKKTNMI